MSGRRVGYRACLVVVDKRNISCRCRDFELRTVRLTASSQYRLRYSGSEMIHVAFKKMWEKKEKPCKVKVKQARYRPGVAQRVPGS